MQMHFIQNENLSTEFKIIFLQISVEHNSLKLKQRLLISYSIEFESNEQKVPLI